MKTSFEQLFDPSKIGTMGSQRNQELFKLAAQEQLRPAKDDRKRHLLLLIDMQNDFMERGSLGVPGSHQDVERTAKFLYEHMEQITDIAVSLDHHHPQQIFHPAWWIDEQGRHPEPMTIIEAVDVEQGRWKTPYWPEESLEYVQQLQRRGKKKLCIWPYHCLEGTYGAALESQMANLVYFHSIARQSVLTRLVKGTDPLSEMYGIIKPEYSKTEQVNHSFLERLQQYDTIVIAGEAKSHCVLESLVQIAEHEGESRPISSKIVILEDCMSDIPGFEQMSEQGYEQLVRDCGIRRTTSTEFQLE